MILILAQLQWLTLKGRVIRSIRLLRQPKYLVGTIVGAAWMGLWVVRPILLSHARFDTLPWMQSVSGLMPIIHRIAAIVVTIVAPLPWLLPWGGVGLPFREAELTMLLQAPLTRRDVIQYGLLKSEVGVFLGALVVSLVFGGRGLSPSALTGFLGTWLVFEFFHLNGKWRALTATGIRGPRLYVTIGVLMLYVVLFSVLVPFVTSVATVLTGMERARVVETLTTLPWPTLLVALTTPAWWITAPMFATKGTVFLISVVPLALLTILQREIVLRSKARFEEGALERAKSEDAKQARGRRGTRHVGWTRERHPFRLSSTGPPEWAVLWKNTVRISRLPLAWSIGGGAALLVAIAVLPAVLRWPNGIFNVTVVFGLVVLIVQPILGGMMWNNDLRGELGHLEAVRTWPVTAERFVLAEVLSPALLSFAAAMFGAGMVLASLLGSRLREAITGEPTTLHLLPRSGAFLGVPNSLATVLFFVGIVPIAASVSFVFSAFQNVAVMLMPAWMAHSVDRNRGVAAVGQRLLTSFGLGVTFFAALMPSALLVGIAVVVQRLLGIPLSAFELPLWGVLGAIPPCVMVWFLLRFAALLWQRLDPSEELLEIGR